MQSRESLLVIILFFIISAISCENACKKSDDGELSCVDDMNYPDKDQLHDEDEDQEVTKPDEDFSINDSDADDTGDEMEMVEITEGSFWMGCNEAIDSNCYIDEYPYHQVELSAFRIGKYEVTVKQYQACVDSGFCNNDNEKAPHYYSDCNLGAEDRGNYPMNCVSWYGAKAYCEWIGKRLPTEAQWEKAARGVDGPIYPWGNEEADCDRANYKGAGKDVCESGSTEVGSRPDGISLSGAYDMAGNVWEWCDDIYDSKYYENSPLKDPQGPQSDEGIRVARGGSWNFSRDGLRTSYRGSYSPAGRVSYIGFRCADDSEDDENPDEDAIQAQCSAGTVRVTLCSTDGKMLQEQICDKDGEWQNNGECSEKMIAIPAGSFKMGNMGYGGEYSEPFHDVVLSAYKIYKYEVMVSQYQACVDAGKCSNNNGLEPQYYTSQTYPYCNLGAERKDGHPMNCVSWYGAKAYCEWIGKRLPTEAEWEKAARGTDGRRYPWGITRATCHYAVLHDPYAGGYGCGFNGTMPVWSKPEGVSPYGLYNMSGNVGEWCSDWFQRNYYNLPSENPTGPSERDSAGYGRVIRGGGWYSEYYSLNTYGRGSDNPEWFGADAGFRCAEDQCDQGDTRIVSCPDNIDRLQKQVCNQTGHWQNEGACYCKTGDTQTIVCIGDSTKSQDLVCNESGKWQNDGACYCETGITMTAKCASDSTMIQKLLCDETGNWKNVGDCMKVFVLCTGETNCYNEDYLHDTSCHEKGSAFYGQDAHYADKGYCTPKSFTVSGTAPEEIVIDNNTGFQWQRTLPEIYEGCTAGGTIKGEQCEWQEATDYCENLVYGGYDDWRLPAVEELETIIDHGKRDPSVDTVYFPDIGTPYNFYWTSTSGIYSSSSFYINFFLGKTGMNSTAAAICVRGESFPQHTFIEKTVNGGIIVTDLSTNLQWAKEYKINLSWKESLEYCENLYYAGYSDWRLPNINELKTLLNRERSEPASNFPDIRIGFLWSSSSRFNGGSEAWFATSDLGTTGVREMSYDWGDAYCVR